MVTSCEISEEILQDCINLTLGLFSPLKGFMNSSDYHSVVDNMLLSNGSVWTIPISLDVNHDTYIKAVDAERLYLKFHETEVGYVKIEDCYKVDQSSDILSVFKTQDTAHPGVLKELKRQPYRIGGEIVITNQSCLSGALDPTITKEYFSRSGWTTVAGFQTRNPIHRAHEYLQRVALEICDGLFINPLVGWKKVGDFSEVAVLNGYQEMLSNYYHGLNVHIDTLRTPMRYAGPREAIFHATVRRNLGCTHFIIGRDHAGVGNFYGKYEAHELARSLSENYDLGIELLLLSEPFYCHKCEQMVSARTCRHEEHDIEYISGTKIREMLVQNKRPNEIMMRKEVADSIILLDDRKFIQD